MMKAKREHLRAFGLTGRDARRIEKALGVFADYEGAIVKALSLGATSGAGMHHQDTCAALRLIVDGHEFRPAK